MPLILPIPTSTTDNVGASVFKLMQLSKMVNESTDNLIVLDFCNTKFQFSCFLAGLFVLCKGWESKGKTVTKVNIHENISNYLEVVNFHDGFNPMSEQDLSYFYRKTFTPLFVFSTNAAIRENCIDAVLNIVFGQTKLTGADCRNVIDYFITELTNNVADHSESENGIVFTQAYPSKGFMDITIADYGVGVFESYNKTDKFNPQTEVEAIEMAVNGCSTKDRPISRGFGISGSRNLLVDGLNGQFWLWSGENIFIHKEGLKDIIRVENGADLKGCYLNLRLPLDITLKGNFYDYIS